MGKLQGSSIIKQTRFALEGNDHPDDSDDEHIDQTNKRSNELKSKNDRVHHYINRRIGFGHKDKKNIYYSTNKELGLEIKRENLEFVRQYYLILTCQILLTGFLMILPYFGSKIKDLMTMLSNSELEFVAVNDQTDELAQNYPEMYSIWLLGTLQMSTIALQYKKLSEFKSIGLTLYQINAASLAYLLKIKVFSEYDTKDTFIMFSLFSSYFIGSTGFSYLIKRDWNSKEANNWGFMTLFILCLQFSLIGKRFFTYHVISMVLASLVTGFYAGKYTEKFVLEKIKKRESLDGCLANHLGRIYIAWIDLLFDKIKQLTTALLAPKKQLTTTKLKED